MMSNPSKVVVVLEDDRHKMFIQRYLRKHGVDTTSVRIERSPSGRGSAEKWVCQRFVKEMAAFRRRHAKKLLIVVVDADRHTVQSRLDQLDQALRDNEDTPVTKKEEVARLVPRRNIETWILCLTEHEVDEETDYKEQPHQWTKIIPDATARLFEWGRLNSELPSNCVDSLKKGIVELRRLDFG